MSARTKSVRSEVQKTNSSESTGEYHFGLAQAYVAEGNPDRAIEEFKLVLMYDPGSALVHARIAAEYIKKGSLSDAMEHCKSALALKPDYVDARLMLAGLYSTTRDTDAAVAEYDKVLKTNPNHEETVVFRAQVLLESGKPERAVKSLQSFVKANPESTLAWYYLGRVQQKLERNKEAAVAFQKAIQIRPEFSQASLALGFLYESQQMNKQAIEVYKQSFESGDDLVSANRLSTILLKEERYQEAIPLLEAISSADPEDLNSRVKLGLVYMELKKFDRSISLFKAILEKNPDSERIHYYLGNLYEETKDMDLAISHLSKIEPTSRLFGDAALHVAMLLKQANRGDEAMKHVVASIERSPRIPGFYIFKASLHEEVRDFAKARSVLSKAYELFPEDEKILYYLGSVLDREGQTDLALSKMEKILAINPDNVDALNYMGYTWTTQGVRLNDAEKALKRAMQIKPDNAYITDSWGWHLYIRGRHKEAVVQLEKAARLKPNEPTILEHLADVYAASDLREKALHHYELAMQFAEDANQKQKLAEKSATLRTEIVRRGSSSNRLPASEAAPSGR